MQISWYNRTRLLKSDGKYVIIDNKHSSDSDHIQSVLILDSVNNTDSGEYTCRAFNNPLCYIEEKIKLTVECEFIHGSINAVVISKNLCMYISTYVYSNTLAM